MNHVHFDLAKAEAQIRNSFGQSDDTRNRMKKPSEQAQVRAKEISIQQYLWILNEQNLGTSHDDMLVASAGMVASFLLNVCGGDPALAEAVIEGVRRNLTRNAVQIAAVEIEPMSGGRA